MLLAFDMMRQNGLLLPDVNNVMQLVMMYPFASWGGMAPDLDHKPDNIKEQTPFNLLVSRVLSITNAKHRSWQTHSIFLTGGLCVLMLLAVYLGNEHFGYTGSIEWAYVRLAAVGVVVGIVSHLFLDMLTPSGIHIIAGRKIRLVPKHSMFSAGGLWDSVVYYLMMLGILWMLYKIIWVSG